MYELLRFWLLGSWLAYETGVAFCLVNLVPTERETDIEKHFGKFIRKYEHAQFSRKTWEDIHQLIESSSHQIADRVKILGYFSNRTIGYRNGVILDLTTLIAQFFNLKKLILGIYPKGISA